MLRDLAIKSGFVDKNLNGKDFNPLSPHALRESFGSIMTGKGVPDVIVDFWLGHEIGEMAEAYKSAKFEDIKQMYLERERFISITANGDLEQKLRTEIEEKSKQLQTLVNGLATENFSLRDRIAKVEGENTDLKSKFDQVNRKLTFLDKYIGLSDVVNSEAKARRVLEFFEALRMEKLAEDRVEEQKAEDSAKAEIKT